MSGNDSDSEAEFDDLKEEGKLVITIQPTTEHSEVTVKLTLTTKFDKIFRAFEKQLNVDKNAYKYLYNQTRAYGDTTPKMLEMKIGRRYVLEAMLEQTGGWKKRLSEGKINKP